MAKEEKEERAYLRYVKEIVNDFVREMEKETGLSCSASGGSMPHDVERLEVRFIEYRRVTLEEARQLEVKAIQKLLKKVNEHEKIRPFLREYPFDHNRVGISLAFETDRAGYYLDGSVAFVCNGNNTIFYDKAEKQLVKYSPIYDGVTGGIFKQAHEEEEEILVPLTTEPYEEAVKIVAATAPLEKPRKK